MPNYVESLTFGPLNYQIEKRGRSYRIWLNGCGIGRARADKPPDEIWEYSTTKIEEARATVRLDAQEELQRRINDAELGLKYLRKALVKTEGREIK